MRTGQQMIIGLLRVFAAVIVGALVGGLLFAGIDWLRTYHSSATISISRMALEPRAADSSLLGLIGAFVDWYSTAFYGYSRFGSGLGTLIGAFWAMGAAKNYEVIARFSVGFIAGFLMGLRTAMFVVSRPSLVLIIAVLGGLMAGAYICLAGRPSRFSPLPRLHLKHQP